MILSGIEQACKLNLENTKSSWAVFKKYGNMSSSTFLFVLNELLLQETTKHWIVGLGIGPGLVIEGLLLRRHASA